MSGRDDETATQAVTPLELFFDLVFVFAISQLSHHLLAHLSWHAAAETLVMLLAIVTVWSYTSWAATMIPAHRTTTHWMVLLVMLLGLFMNSGVTSAFTTSGLAFAAPLLLIQFGRTAWTLANAPNESYREHYVRVLIWLALTAPLWIAGAFAKPDARLLWWGAAAGLDVVGTWLAHPVPRRRLRSESMPFDAEHMLERCRLFLIIALGESVLTTGTAVSHAEPGSMAIVTGTCALAGTVALWSLSFGRAHRLVQQHLEDTSDPILASRYAVNALMVMVAGLVAMAVAHEKVIAAPFETTTTALGFLLGGGPLLFLAAHGWYLRAVPRASPRLHVIGGGALALLGAALVATAPPAWIALAAASLGLLSVALLDRGAMSDRPCAFPWR
jgi:low temperature requirement protein LtrA